MSETPRPPDLLKRPYHLISFIPTSQRRVPSAAQYALPPGASPVAPLGARLLQDPGTPRSPPDPGGPSKGPIYLTRPIEKVDGAVRITRNRRGQFFMHVPTKVPFTDIPARKAQAQRTVVALDPGVRTFQTTFSPTDGCGEYCAKENGFAAVFKEALKCDETRFAIPG